MPATTTPSSGPVDIAEKRTLPDPTMNTENKALAPDTGGVSSNGQGQLQVPSRSSSQKHQSQGTTTGLSGATVSDSRNSISARSKDSKSSFLGRQRNGSASSNRQGGDTQSKTALETSQPSSPSTSSQKKKKSGGLLSFLGCCGVPDSANAVDGETENAHKVDKVPQRPTTAKSRTQTSQEHGPVKSSNSKESQQKTAVNTSEDTPMLDSTDSTPADPSRVESSHLAGPTVTVEPPLAQTHDVVAPETNQTTESQDIEMRDTAADQSSVQPANNEEITAKTIPPPPPGPGPIATIPVSLAEQIAPLAEARKWLLPAILPEHSGRKCLVLDLDETLVHSSFKVGCHIDSYIFA